MLCSATPCVPLLLPRHCYRLCSVSLLFSASLVLPCFAAFMCSPALALSLTLESFMLISKLASRQKKSGMESVEESQFPRLLWRLAEAHWNVCFVLKNLPNDRTVGGFIIIFLLHCMYNDCPHYKTQDDVHNYITLDGSEKRCIYCAF